MATFFLINSIIVVGNRMLAGDTVDDAVENTAPIIAAGGLLWPSNDPIIAAAALVAQNAHKNRGANEQELDSIMQTAVQSAQRRDDQAGTVTLIAGVLLVAAGVTITATSKIFVSLNTPGGGGNGVDYKVPDASRVVGGPGVGAFTITAVDAAGATVVTDVSTVNWHVIN